MSLEIPFEHMFSKNNFMPRKNKFGLRRTIRMISERVVFEYSPLDSISVREIIHPLHVYRTPEPYFEYSLVSNSDEYLTSIDFHHHASFFPYAKSDGSISMIHYINSFDDKNFTKVSRQRIMQFPGEIIEQVRFGILDKGYMAVNHHALKNGNESTVSIIDLVNPTRTVALFDSNKFINDVQWSPRDDAFFLISDVESLRIIDLRCPKSYKAVFFPHGVDKMAINPLKENDVTVLCDNNVLLFDIRRPDFPFQKLSLDLEEDKVYEMRYNIYLPKQLMIHTENNFLYALEVDGEVFNFTKKLKKNDFDPEKRVTFKNVDRGAYTKECRETRTEIIKCSNVEIPLFNYFEHYEMCKIDEDYVLPIAYNEPTTPDSLVSEKPKMMDKIDIESQLENTVNLILADTRIVNDNLKVFYAASNVESFDFLFPGLNGVLFMRSDQLKYEVKTNFFHFEASFSNDPERNDAAQNIRRSECREMVPVHTLFEMIERVDNGWDAMMKSKVELNKLATAVTKNRFQFWSQWLNNSAQIQYGGRDFVEIGSKRNTRPLPKHLPTVNVPPYAEPNYKEATREVIRMLGPFYQIFLPKPWHASREKQALLDKEEKGEKDESNESNESDESDESDESEEDHFEKIGKSNLLKEKKRKPFKRQPGENLRRLKKVKQYKYLDFGDDCVVRVSPKISTFLNGIQWKKCQTLHEQKVENLPESIEPIPKENLEETTEVSVEKTADMKKDNCEDAKQNNTAETSGDGEKETENTEPMDIADTLENNKFMDAVYSYMPISRRVKPPPPPPMPIFVPPPPPPKPKPPPPPSPPPPPPPPPPSRKHPKTRSKMDDFRAKSVRRMEANAQRARDFSSASNLPKKEKEKIKLVYASKPKRLTRYSPKYLNEFDLIQHIEKGMNILVRNKNRKMFVDDFEETPNKEQTANDEALTDMKFSLLRARRSGWFTFFNPFFFFSKKCSYTQLIASAMRIYNATRKSALLKKSKPQNNAKLNFKRGEIQRVLEELPDLESCISSTPTTFSDFDDQEEKKENEDQLFEDRQHRAIIDYNIRKWHSMDNLSEVENEVVLDLTKKSKSQDEIQNDNSKETIDNDIGDRIKLSEETKQRINLITDVGSYIRKLITESGEHNDAINLLNLLSNPSIMVIKKLISLDNTVEKLESLPQKEIQIDEWNAPIVRNNDNDWDGNLPVPKKAKKQPFQIIYEQLPLYYESSELAEDLHKAKMSLSANKERKERQKSMDNIIMLPFKKDNRPPLVLPGIFKKKEALIHKLAQAGEFDIEICVNNGRCQLELDYESFSENGDNDEVEEPTFGRFSMRPSLKYFTSPGCIVSTSLFELFEKPFFGKLPYATRIRIPNGSLRSFNRYPRNNSGRSSFQTSLSHRDRFVSASEHFTSKFSSRKNSVLIKPSLESWKRCKFCIKQVRPIRDVCLCCTPNPKLDRCTIIVKLPSVCYRCNHPVYQLKCHELGKETYVRKIMQKQKTLMSRREFLMKFYEKRNGRLVLKRRWSRYKRRNSKGSSSSKASSPHKKRRLITASLMLKPNYLTSKGRFDDGNTSESDDENVLINFINENRKQRFIHSQDGIVSTFMKKEYSSISLTLDSLIEDKGLVDEELQGHIDVYLEEMRKNLILKSTKTNEGEKELRTVIDKKTGEKVKRWVTVRSKEEREERRRLRDIEKKRREQTQNDEEKKKETNQLEEDDRQSDNLERDSPSKPSKTSGNNSQESDDDEKNNDNDCGVEISVNNTGLVSSSLQKSPNTLVQHKNYSEGTLNEPEQFDASKSPKPTKSELVAESLSVEELNVVKIEENEETKKTTGIETTEKTEEGTKCEQEKKIIEKNDESFKPKQEVLILQSTGNKKKWKKLISKSKVPQKQLEDFLLSIFGPGKMYGSDWKISKIRPKKKAIQLLIENETQLNEEEAKLFNDHNLREISNELDRNVPVENCAEKLPRENNRSVQLLKLLDNSQSDGEMTEINVTFDDEINKRRAQFKNLYVKPSTQVKLLKKLCEFIKEKNHPNCSQFELQTRVEEFMKVNQKFGESFEKNVEEHVKTMLKQAKTCIMKRKKHKSLKRGKWGLPNKNDQKLRQFKFWEENMKNEEKSFDAFSPIQKRYASWFWKPIKWETNLNTEIENDKQFEELKNCALEKLKKIDQIIFKIESKLNQDIHLFRPETRKSTLKPSLSKKFKLGFLFKKGKKIVKNKKKNIVLEENQEKKVEEKPADSYNNFVHNQPEHFGAEESALTKVQKRVNPFFAPVSNFFKKQMHNFEERAQHSTSAAATLWFVRKFSPFTIRSNNSTNDRTMRNSHHQPAVTNRTINLNGQPPTVCNSQGSSAEDIMALVYSPFDQKKREEEAEKEKEEEKAKKEKEREERGKSKGKIGKKKEKVGKQKEKTKKKTEGLGKEIEEAGKSKKKIGKKIEETGKRKTKIRKKLGETKKTMIKTGKKLETTEKTEGKAGKELEKSEKPKKKIDKKMEETEKMKKKTRKELGKPIAIVKKPYQFSKIAYSTLQLLRSRGRYFFGLNGTMNSFLSKGLISLKLKRQRFLRPPTSKFNFSASSKQKVDEFFKMKDEGKLKSTDKRKWCKYALIKNGICSAEKYPVCSQLIDGSGNILIEHISYKHRRFASICSLSLKKPKLSSKLKKVKMTREKRLEQKKRLLLLMLKHFKNENEVEKSFKKCEKSAFLYYLQFAQHLAKKAMYQMKNGKSIALFFGVIRVMRFRYASFLNYRKNVMSNFLKKLKSSGITWKYDNVFEMKRKDQPEKLTKLILMNKPDVLYPLEVKPTLRKGCKLRIFKRNKPIESIVNENKLAMKHQARYHASAKIVSDVQKYFKLKCINKNSYLPANVFETFDFESDEPKEDSEEDDDFEEDGFEEDGFEEDEFEEDEFSYESEEEEFDLDDEELSYSSESVLSERIIVPPVSMKKIDEKIRAGEIMEDNFLSEYSDPEYADKPDESYDKKLHKEFWKRESPFSGYNVKGIPGLLFLSRLAHDRFGEHLNQNMRFVGPGLENYKGHIRISPIRRLMLMSLGLPLPDRFRKMSRIIRHEDGVKSWFSSAFQAICYGRGNLTRTIMTYIHNIVGKSQKLYLGIEREALAVTRLFRKMVAIKKGEEDIALADLIYSSVESMDHVKGGISIDDFEMAQIRRRLKTRQAKSLNTFDLTPWSEEDWVKACDQFIIYATNKKGAIQEGIACALVMKMIFLNGYSENVFKDILKLNISTIDKCLFVINLAPCENILDNFAALFNEATGLDRLPFVGLGYHVDSLQIIKEEAIVSSDCQLTTHLLTLGKCLDQNPFAGIEDEITNLSIKKRDLGELVSNLFEGDNGENHLREPTLTEACPFSFLKPKKSSGQLATCEDLVKELECDVSKYITILDMINGGSTIDGTIGTCPRFLKTFGTIPVEVSCDTCRTSILQSTHLADYGHEITISANPTADQLYKESLSVTSKTVRRIEDQKEEDLIPYLAACAAQDANKTEEELEELPSSQACQKCRRPFARCSVCTLHYLTLTPELSEVDRYNSDMFFAVCMICNHGGHMRHLTDWFSENVQCPVSQCRCRCLPIRTTASVKFQLQEDMLQSSNMRKKMHICNPSCCAEQKNLDSN